jgi:hypothetical protein
MGRSGSTFGISHSARSASPRLALGIRHLAFTTLLLLSGCAHYEYDIVEPKEFARHVGGKSWVSVRRDELEYRLRSYDSRLVMLIYNRGDKPMKLLGADSAAVDPRGESHPLQSATILPGTYVKRIFPPPPRVVERSGPRFGVGAGVASGPGGFRDRGDPLYRGYDDFGPQYYAVYDRTSFEWPGQTTVRLLLTYQREAGETFRHDWVLRRRKM